MSYQGKDRFVSEQWTHVPGYMTDRPRVGEPNDQAVAFVLGRLSPISELLKFLSRALSS